MTLAAVARAAGVSPMTASNAYNRPDQLSAESRRRVLEAARRLRYAGPDAVARSLRRGRVGAVGVVFANPLSYAFEDPAAVRVLAGISAAAEEAELGLVLVPGSPGGRRAPDAVREAAVDGLVVDSLSEEDPVLDAALGRGLPVVVVDQPPGTGEAFVGVDDRGGARAAAEHLLGLGHRRFGVVSFALDSRGGRRTTDLASAAGAPYRVTGERAAGVAAALGAAGLDPSAVPVAVGRTSSVEEGRGGAASLLSATPRPTALVALSDQLAVGCVEAVTATGSSVPGDVSVVGFDDVVPGLTTVRQDHVAKGRRAGAMLLDRLAGEPVPPPVVLPTSLVVRGSTSTAAG